MATLAAGASVEITLAAGQSVTFEAVGAGVAVVTAPESPPINVTLGSSVRTIGPYKGAATVRVSSTGGALGYAMSTDGAPAGGVPIADGYPDPRKPGGVSAQVVLPGATSQHVATGIGGRILVAGSGATNTNAGISVVSASGRKTDAIQGATDAVNMRFADLGEARQPLLVTTGSSAAAIVVEVL